MTKEERLDYLESERVKIWEKITSLSNLLNKKTSDYENDAKLSAEQASQFEISSKEAATKISIDLEEANSKLESIKSLHTYVEQLGLKIKEYSDSANQNNDSIISVSTTVNAKASSIQTQIAEIEKIFDGKPVLDEKLIKLGDIFAKGDDYDSKLSTLYKSINERKKEIDELYYKIIGYSEKNETGEETRIEGLKDELQNSFTQTVSRVDAVEKALTNLKTDTELNYGQFIEESGTNFNNSITNWKNEFLTIKSSIEQLLPNALTAGLSFAYSEKKEKEEKENQKFATTFKYAIGGLVAISCIPLLVSIKSIADDITLEEVILRIPRLVLAILPLYIPILWVAYSSNRKMNLSKRLVEEYSHKEVLSKTFEGLSGQINNISDKEISADLRVKLLYNILEVNSENPGKLISDYNKADHPLMDALDKSIKLTDAVTKLAKIPGFSKLASTLDKKSHEILKKHGEKVNAGLDIIDTPSKVTD